MKTEYKSWIKYATKEGRVKDNDHFEDLLWHCWDNTLQDIICE